MKINKKEFKKLSINKKIEKIIEINKAKLILKGKIENYVYLVDKENNLYIVPIKKKKYLYDEEYASLFKGILKNIIEDYQKENIFINNLFYLKKSFFNNKYSNFNKLDIDNTFNNSNANKALLVYCENIFEIDLLVYDRITGIDQGKKYTVLSKNPIKRLKYCKIDPEDELKGNLINII